MRLLLRGCIALIATALVVFAFACGADVPISVSNPPGPVGDDDTTFGDDDDAVGDDDDSAEVSPGCLDDPGPALAVDLCASEAPCVMQGTVVSEMFGFSMSASGDFDGDGSADLAVGAPGFDRSDGTEVGRVVLFTQTALRTADLPASAVIEGTASSQSLGMAVSFVGDVNGDGVDDLAIGMPGEGSSPVYVGAVALVFGRSLDESQGTVTLSPDVLIRGETTYSRVGRSLAAMGDINGDGFDDFAFGADLAMVGSSTDTGGDGSVRVFLGRSQWPSEMTTAEADHRISGGDTGSTLGRSIAGGVDVTGDGVLDLLVGEPGANFYQGAAWLVSGSAFALGSLDASITAVGQQVAQGLNTYDNFGWSVAMAEDLTGYGVGDFAVGSPLSDTPQDGAGHVEVFAGGPNWADGTGGDSLAILTGEWDDFEFGTSLQAADLNGDSLSDLVVGAIQAWEGFNTKAGRVHVFFGGEGAWSPVMLSENAEVDITGPAPDGYLGMGLAAGDLSGDGRVDLVVAAPYNDGAGSNTGAIFVFRGE